MLFFRIIGEFSFPGKLIEFVERFFGAQIELLDVRPDESFYKDPRGQQVKAVALKKLQIGDGNLEHRLDVRSGDEIEMLASEFNRMADRMQRTQDQLQRRGKELEQRVNQLRRLQAQLTQSERMAATNRY